jgi:tight adherence protein B
MDGMLQPLIIAACVGLLVWWVMGLMTGGEEKKKLQERLTGEGSPDANTARGPSVVLASSENAIPEFLREKPWAVKMQSVLCQAYPDSQLKTFIIILLSLISGAFLIAMLISGGKLLVALGAAAFFAYVPFWVVLRKRAQRQQLINTQLPEALEFLSRVMRAGHSLSTGLQMMADELPKPLSDEFRRAYDQHSLGQSLEDALRGAATRVNSTDFAFFVTSVLIQRQTGGDLSEVLNNISNMIRARIHLQQHVKSKTAEGRFTGYIMVAFPAVMFCICYFLNPDYCGVLLHTSTGEKLLAVAFGLQMSGLWMINKITTVRV